MRRPILNIASSVLALYCFPYCPTTVIFFRYFCLPLFLLDDLDLAQKKIYCWNSIAFTDGVSWIVETNSVSMEYILY